VNYINLGRSGLKVSRICLGTLTFGDKEWRSYVLNEDESRPIIQKALELGINFFDTADMYSFGVSEKILGRALKDFARRDEVVIASKVYYQMSDNVNDQGLSRKHILKSIDDSLRRLNTDYIDLYQIHRWDYKTPIEETMETLHDLVRSGKVRYLGASSMFAWQLAKALYCADQRQWTRFISMQNHYNLVYREEEREMSPLCLSEGVGLIPWSPLARGFLAGNREQGGGGSTNRAKNDPFADEMYFRPNDFEILDRVGSLADQLGVNPAQIALSWLLHKPAVSAPIIGVSRMVHLEEAVESLNIKLDTSQMTMLEEAYQPHPILGHE